MNRSERQPTKSDELLKDQSKSRSPLKLLVRIAGSLLALYLLYTQIDFRQAFELLGSSNTMWAIAALLAFNLSQIISSFRLNRFFSAIGIHLSEIFNLRLYYIGMFYNLLLPGGIGGDGFKAYLLRKRSETSLSLIIRALLADRLNGLIAIGILILVITLFIRNLIPLPFSKYIWAGAPVLIAGIAIYVLLFRKFAKIAWLTVVLSLLIQGAQLLTVFFLLRALHIESDLPPYLLIFLLSSVAAVLPISIGGLGLREVVFLYGARLFGLDPEISVAVSLFFFLITAFSSLIGFYLHQTMKDRHWEGQRFEIPPA